MTEPKIEKINAILRPTVGAKIVDLSVLGGGSVDDVVLRTGAAIDALTSSGLELETFDPSKRALGGGERDSAIAEQLTDCLKIYIPHGNDEASALRSLDEVQAALVWLTDKFGGATAIDGIGSWKSPSGDVVEEPCTIVIAYMPNGALASSSDSVLAFMDQLKQRLGQDAVACELNDDMILR